MSKAILFEASTTVDEVIAEQPRSVTVFHRHGMHCPTCELGRFTTLAEACETYHQDLGDFLQELQSVGRPEHRHGTQA